MVRKPPLATTDQVAEYLQISPRTLDRWAYEGTGPDYVLAGQQRRYRWEDVESWLRRPQPASSRHSSAVTGKRSDPGLRPGRSPRNSAAREADIKLPGPPAVVVDLATWRAGRCWRCGCRIATTTLDDLAYCTALAQAADAFTSDPPTGTAG